MLTQQQEDPMPINSLYHTWIMRIRQLLPTERKTRIISFAWLIIGIHQSCLVYLSRIAGKIPGKAKLLSTIRRMTRFLANPSVNVRDWYAPIARSWLEMQAKYLQQVRLIVDDTQVGFVHQLLYVLRQKGRTQYVCLKKQSGVTLEVG